LFIVKPSLGLNEGTCFGHVLFKGCQYSMNDDKVSMGLRQVSVKDAQIGLHKTITWTKNQEGEARVAECLC
jgi:hypothetical protein